MYAVSLGEPVLQFASVLPGALDQIRGYPNIERSVAAAGHEVDARLLHPDTRLGPPSMSGPRSLRARPTAWIPAFAGMTAIGTHGPPLMETPFRRPGVSRCPGPLGGAANHHTPSVAPPAARAR